VDFLDSVGYIHVDHLDDPWGVPGSFQIGGTVFPRVLYVTPNNYIPYLTLQSKHAFSKNVVKNFASGVRLGEKEKVLVVRIEKRGLIIKFESGERGFVSSTRCSDDSSLSDHDISIKFKVGSTHTCRVLEYSGMDNMYICSMQE